MERMPIKRIVNVLIKPTVVISLSFFVADFGGWSFVVALKSQLNLHVERILLTIKWSDYFFNFGHYWAEAAISFECYVK
jgi:hypothetical protein